MDGSEFLYAAIAEAMFKDDYDMRDPNKISVTSLIDAPYRRLLRQKHSEELKAKERRIIDELRKGHIEHNMSDLSDSLWRLLGNAIHAILDKTNSAVTEFRVETDVAWREWAPPCTITGKADIYLPNQKLLADYKVTSKYTLENVERMQEWEHQLSILKYLFIKNGLDVDNVFIIAILRDYTKRDKFSDRFPNSPFVVVPFNLPPLNQIENYIKQRIAIHQAPAPCNDKDRWSKSDQWAVFKDGGKRAKKIYFDEAEAKLSLKAGEYIEFRKGEYVRCEQYCDLKPYCYYYKSI